MFDFTPTPKKKKKKFQRLRLSTHYTLKETLKASRINFHWLNSIKTTINTNDNKNISDNNKNHRLKPF